MPPVERPIVRGCDGCTVCCKLFGVRSINKPAGVWCQHCKAGTGCTIYGDRPTECSEFVCGYLVLPGLGPEWKPSVSHLMISSEGHEGRLNIHVDPNRPEAWRKQPYYAWIKEWSRKVTADRGQVTVMIGRRVIAILPDQDVDFGSVAPDELIVTSEVMQNGKRTWEAFAVKTDDAVGQKIHEAKGKPVRIDMSRTENFRRGRLL
jgi:hypothetical protein